MTDRAKQNTEPSLADLREKYPTIPERTIESLVAYRDDGLIPGDFLWAVLSNRLFDSFHRADSGNAAALQEIVRFCWWEIPACAQGNSKKVAAWIEKKEGER